MIASISLFVVVQFNFCNRDFVIDHKLSGEFPCQSNNFCFLKVVFIVSGERHGAISYWNFPSPSGNAFLIAGITFLSITSMCLHKCITVNPHLALSQTCAGRNAARRIVWCGPRVIVHDLEMVFQNELCSSLFRATHSTIIYHKLWHLSRALQRLKFTNKEP